MNSRSVVLLAAAFVSLLLTFAPAAALSEEPSREIPIRIGAELKDLGISAANATVLAKGAKGNPGPGPAIVAFVSFEQSFYGELHLRGYTRNNTEIARSAPLEVSRKPEEAGHITFTFDAATTFTKVSHFTLMGEKRQNPPPKPAPQKESIGQETKNIIRELLQ